MFNEPMPINPFTGLTALGFSRRGPIGRAFGGAPDDNGGGGGGGGGENNNGGGANGGGGANNNGGGSGGGGNNNGGGGSNNNGGGGNGGAGGNNNGGNNSDEAKPYTQAQLDAMFEDRVARDRKARGVENFDTYKQSHEQLQELLDKDLPEADRLRRVATEKETEAADAKQRAEKSDLVAMQYRVAAAKDIPLSLAERLQGATKEELEADADKFLAETGVIGAGVGGNGRPLPNFQQGGGGTPTGGSTAAGRELYKQRNNK